MLHSFQTPEFLTAVNIVFDLPKGLNKEDLEQRLGDKVTCLLVMMGTFGSLGIVVFRHDIDIALVEDFFSGVLVLSRKKLQRYLDQVRQSSGRERYYEWYQWLSEQVERRDPAPRSRDDVRRPAVHIGHHGQPHGAGRISRPQQRDRRFSEVRRFRKQWIVDEGLRIAVVERE